MRNAKATKNLLLLLLVALVSIPLAVIPDIISPTMEEWLEANLGENYQQYFILFFITATLLMVWRTTNIQDRLFSGKKEQKADQLSIEWTAEHTKYLKEAKQQIRHANPKGALKKLAQIEHSELREQIDALSIRLAKFQKESIQGVQTYEQESTAFNRLNKDILSLIGSLKASQQEGEAYVIEIRKYLRKRYDDRLRQKLAARQPVNLRRIPSIEGTSEDTAEAFVTYGTNEIQEGIADIFQHSYGRLLIVGAPGAGKTTLLLKLVLSLLQSEKNALPVVLNLATWQPRFSTLEEWLAQILPAEIGVNKSLAEKVIKEYPLILLLDGLDEVIVTERAACLAGIGRYGANSRHRFVLTSRKAEYNAVAKDAPVNAQIEVGALLPAQLEAELLRIGRQQPEAMPLLQAIRKDELLQVAVQTPFYFNILQLLFAQGKRLNDLHFSATTAEGRQAEIRDCFIEDSLQAALGKDYRNHNIRQWLAFLAYNMNRENLVVFELIHLQYNWYSTLSSWERKVAIALESLIKNWIRVLAMWLTFGLTGGLAGGLAGEVPFYEALYNGLAFGLVIGPVMLLYSFVISMLETQIGTPRKIEARDNIKWSSSGRFSIDGENLVGLFNMLGGVLVFGLSFVLVIGLFIGFGRMLYEGLILGLDKEMYEWLYDGLYDGLFFTLAFGLVYGLVGWPFDKIIETLEHDHFAFLQISKPYQRFAASAKNLHFSILRHFHLRYLLYKKGVLPFKLVAFLRQMTQHHLLESDGASWRFRHRILQDYFAKVWEKEYAATESE